MADLHLGDGEDTPPQNAAEAVNTPLAESERLVSLTDANIEGLPEELRPGMAPEAQVEQTARQDAHRKAKRGIKLLMGRQVILQIVTMAGGIVLARKLLPAEFGLFTIATFLVGSFALLGDFGLASSFIQREKELTERDLQVAFTLQQTLTGLVVIALFVTAPWLTRFYATVPPGTVWLIRALAFSLFLQSWRSMSALQMERHLRYDRLALIEVIETLVYQGLAVGLALLGRGVWSLFWAALMRGLVGTLLAYIAAPWRIRLAYDRSVAREIVRYGIPFQVQALTNSVGGWVTPLIVGRLIGPQAVGYLTWASSNGKKPLMLVDNIMRVAFPHFSRIQNDIAEVERTLARYLMGLFLIMGLWFSLLLTAGTPLVHWIYTDKWTPAVTALILYSAAMGADTLTWVVGVTLNALGKVNFTTRVVFVRSLLQIGLSIPAVFALGFLGVPIAYIAAVLLTAPWTLNGLGQGAMRRVLGPCGWILIPVGLGACAGLFSRSLLLPAAPQALLTGTVTLVAYLGGGWLAAPPWMRQTVLARITRGKTVTGVNIAGAGSN